MANIVVVDDDRSVLELVTAALDSLPVTVRTAESAEAAFDLIRSFPVDVLILDINLPDISGLEMVDQVHSIDARIPIVFVTVSESSDIAIEAIQRGAFDFLNKPLNLEMIQDVVERALETRTMQVPVAVDRDDSESSETLGEDVMIGKSPRMLEVYKEIGRVAAKDVTVLICGDSGTGKELVARAIYQHSERKDKPFLAVNCAALTDTLLESELFGHEKGAFTGAEQRRIGKFEQCSGGTLFLDEVGDMSTVLQSKVLRLLQEQTFERVGGRETIRTDVRIISATNRDLRKMITENDFRLDLYHRLNSYRIDLPPLSERLTDLELLVKYFFKKLVRSLDTDHQGISPAAIETLKRYPWPGNVRQLHSVLRRALLKSTAPMLVPGDFPPELNQAYPNSMEARSAESSSANSIHTSNGVATAAQIPSDLKPFVDQLRRTQSNELYQETLEFMERYLLTRVLQENQGNQSKTAEELGTSRGRLRNKIRALGISIEKVVEL